MNSEMLAKQVKRQELLTKLYRLGTLSHKEVAAKVTLDYGTVRLFWVKNHRELGLPKPPRSGLGSRARNGFTQNLAQAHQEYEVGLTLKQVGEKYGNVSRERVRQVFKKHGLKTRSRETVGAARRKYFHCDLGHPLGKDYSRQTCPVCVAAKRERRAKCLHLKTHCLHGHAMVEGNVNFIYNMKGTMSRQCRICQRASLKRSIARKKLRESIENQPAV